MLRVALGFAFALGWLPLFVFRTETVSQAVSAYDAGERLWVRLSHVCFSVHVSAACVSVSFTPSPPWRAVLGVLIFSVGIGFWLWARMAIGPLRQRCMPDRPPARLRFDGPFGIVRHPLYFSFLLAAAAPAVVAAQPFLVPSFLLCCVALAVRAIQEERRLHAQLGAAYTAYCRVVKRLVPLVW